MPKRNHSKYELRDNGKLVYVGITNDIDRRVEEHRDSGKRFTSASTVGNKTTEGGAKNWEENRLETYRNNHGGKNPRHNKTDHG
ncbi:MAG: GIY-YIG nuclease family protein [Fibrobacterales bacterium]